jgi:PAS domain S-box-containing protein
MLYQLAHDLARAIDSTAIAEHLFARTHAILGAEYGILMLATPDGSELYGVASREIAADRFRQERIRVDDESSSASLAFRTQQPVIIAEVATDPRIDQRFRDAYPHVQSAWAAPLMAGARAVGVLSIGFAVSRTATPAELRLLQLLGDEAALALERARLTEEIQASEARYRLMAEHSSDLIARQTPDGRYLYVSPASRILFGYAPEELVGHSFCQWVHPDDQTALRDAWMTLLETQDNGTLTYRSRRKDGGYLWVETTSRVIRETTTGAIVELQTASRDITLRKQAEAVLRTMQTELERQVQEQTAALRTANAALQEEMRKHERTAAGLREAEERYRELVENLNDVIYTQDEQGRFTYVSPVVEALSGYHPQEMLGRPFTDFIHPADLPALLDSWQRTLAGQLEPSEFRVRLKSGAWRWARSSSRPIVRAGRVHGLHGIITDITDRKQAEQQAAALLEVAKDVNGTLQREELLDRVQRRMATVLPCEMVGTFFWDPSRGVFRVLSHHGVPPAALPLVEALAFPPEEPFGGRLSRGQAVIIPDVHAQSWLPVELLTQCGITALVAVPLLVRERELGALVACRAAPGESFDPWHVELCHGIARQVAVALEVAELYQQQQEEAEVARVLARMGRELLAPLNTAGLLEHLCRLTSEALEGSWCCTLLWQREEAVYRVVANWGYAAAQQERLGVLTVPAEAVATLWGHFTTADVLDLHEPRGRELLPSALCHQLGLERALLIRLRRGEEVCGFHACGYAKDLPVSARQLRLARGIAQLASLALANAQLVEELTQANRIKEDFVGLMSHELRTPLNIIVGYTQLLVEETFGPLRPEQVEILGRVMRNSRELLDLITATLDLSRLQNQERLSLTLQEVEAAAVLAELENESRQLPRQPTVQLQWQRTPHLPRLQTDLLKLKMVLKNLLTNALKFTETGTITVSAQSCRDGIEFSVTDTGRGISREALPRIFEPFQQDENSLTPRHSGVGLGLYIVRQVVALLGGQIRVDSEVGRGSTFRVWLPARRES